MASALSTVSVRNPNHQTSRKPLEHILVPHQLRKVIAIKIAIARWDGQVSEPTKLAEILERYSSERQKWREKLQKCGSDLNETRDSDYRVIARDNLVHHGFHARPFRELIESAATQPFPILCWDLGHALNHHRVARGTVGITHSPVPEAIEAHSFFDSKTFRKTYRKMFREITDAFLTQVNMVSAAYVYPEVLDLHGGKLDDQIVVGSSFLDENRPELPIKPAPMYMGEYPMDVDYQVVCEGAMALMTRVDETGASGHDSRQRACNFISHVQPKPKRLYSTHLIMEFL